MKVDHSLKTSAVERLALWEGGPVRMTYALDVCTADMTVGNRCSQHTPSISLPRLDFHASETCSRRRPRDDAEEPDVHWPPLLMGWSWGRLARQSTYWRHVMRCQISDLLAYSKGKSDAFRRARSFGFASQLFIMSMINAIVRSIDFTSHPDV